MRILANRRLHRALADDRGSIPMVMLVIMIAMSLSALLIPIFLVQSNSTRHDSVRMHALNAAETGLQAALGAVRSAADPTGTGVNSKLPCGTAVTGQVNDSASTNDQSQYRVSLVYYASDPRGQSASWLAANAISCANLTTTTPTYVMLNSTGTNYASFGQSGDRVLTATYPIRTNNQNIPGGLIQNYYDGAATYLSLCMDAGSSSPAAGTAVQAQLCQYNVPDQQKFSYQNNLTIVLNSSVTATSAGMCLQANGAGLIVLQPCITSGSTLYTQQWSFNDGAYFQSATSSGGLGNTCMEIQTLDFAGSNVILSGCSGPRRQSNWLPSPAVGAGMAGPNTAQMVNFKQFGRCMDLQEWGLSNPLIAYPCKQTPDGRPGWNQRWVYNSTTKTLSIDAGPANGPVANITTPYCAIAPGATASGTALRVKVTPCPDPDTATPPNLQWTSHYSASETYRDRYSYTDFTGTRCMAPSTSDYYNGTNVSFIVVAPCDGSLLQKWNGDPYVLLASPLRDANEK